MADEVVAAAALAVPGAGARVRACWRLAPCALPCPAPAPVLTCLPRAQRATCPHRARPQDVAFPFGTALVTMFYGPGLFCKAKVRVFVVRRSWRARALAGAGRRMRSVQRARACAHAPQHACCAPQGLLRLAACFLMPSSVKRKRE